MGRLFYFRAVLLAMFLAASAGPVRAQDALLTRVEEALRATDQGAVHDLGGLLKPGGVRELQQLAERFRSQDGINVYFVTVPRGSANVDPVAEQAYRDLQGSPSDILIVFDGKRVYGKTLALKGDTQAFQDALQQAKPGFQRYYAAGLADFAQALRDRIVQRRQGGRAAGSASAPGAAPLAGPGASEPMGPGERTSPVVPVLGILLALVIIVTGILFVRQRAAAGPTYQERVKAAEQIYDRVTLALPDPAPADLNNRWIGLDERLRRVRDPKTANLASLMDLTDDLKAFEREISASSGGGADARPRSG